MTDGLSPHLAHLVDDAVPGEVAPFAAVVARRRRRRATRLAIGATAVAVAAVAIGVPVMLSGQPDAGPSPAPATQSPTDRTTPTTATTAARPEPTYEWGNSPSPIVLRLAEHDLELAPWTSCWSGPPDAGGISAAACADGFAPDEGLEEVGAPASIDFWFGRPGWQFDATFQELGVKCPRHFTVPAASAGEQGFLVEPAGPAGRYRVDLFGRGPEGDVITSFIWDTPTDGPTDPPRATMALISDDGDGLTSYGLEVSVQDLADQPDTASVEVTATAANGRSTTITAPRSGGGNRCYDRGSLFFDDNESSRAHLLGPAPYTYEVVLTLDGKEYVGTAEWPRDEIKSEAPYTRLSFEPPLPAYTGD
jgi:hypothetical protein